MHDHPLGLGVADVVEEAVAAGRCSAAKRSIVLLHDARAGGVEGVAGLAGLEEGVGVLRRAAQHRLVGVSARARWARDRPARRSSRAGRRRREPRSSPPRARCGSRRRSAGTARASAASRRGRRPRGRAPPAPSPRRAARSRSAGRPSRRSGRRRSTARGWRACAPPRACRTAVSSPAILYMLGIISSRPCDAVKVVASAPAWRAPWTAPAAPAFGLHLDHLAGTVPQRFGSPVGRPLVGQLAHRRGRGDRVDGDHLAQPWATEATASLPSTVRSRGGLIRSGKARDMPWPRARGLETRTGASVRSAPARSIRPAGNAGRSIHPAGHAVSRGAVPGQWSSGRTLSR